MTAFSIIIGAVVLIVVCMLLVRKYFQWQIVHQARRLASAGGISEVKEVILGGLKQYILIQAAEAGKPVLLVMHGGPGLPVPGVGCRGADWLFNLNASELIKSFTVVFWDQRGTGKTFSTETSTACLNLEQFIVDANELTDWLCTKFRQEKIYLAGISWGSVLGLQLADRYPHKFHAYIGIAQIVNWAESDKNAYDWLLKRATEAGNRKALQELANIGRPPYFRYETWTLLRKWLFALGGYIYEDGRSRQPGMFQLFKTLLKSPDYRLSDIGNIFRNGMKLSYSPRMLNDFAEFDALSSIRRLEIPIYFFHGVHDRAISGQLLEQFYNQLETPEGKSLTWLGQSAHIFSPDDSRRVEKSIIKYCE